MTKMMFVSEWENFYLLRVQGFSVSYKNYKKVIDKSIQYYIPKLPLSYTSGNTAASSQQNHFGNKDIRN